MVTREGSSAHPLCCPAGSSCAPGVTCCDQSAVVRLCDNMRSSQGKHPFGLEFEQTGGHGAGWLKTARLAVPRSSDKQPLLAAVMPVGCHPDGGRVAGDAEGPIARIRDLRAWPHVSGSARATGLRECNSG